MRLSLITLTIRGEICFRLETIFFSILHNTIHPTNDSFNTQVSKKSAPTSNWYPMLSPHRVLELLHLCGFCTVYSHVLSSYPAPTWEPDVLSPFCGLGSQEGLLHTWEMLSRFLPDGGISFLSPGWVLPALSWLVTATKDGDDHWEYWCLFLLHWLGAQRFVCTQPNTSRPVLGKHGSSWLHVTTEPLNHISSGWDTL